MTADAPTTTTAKKPWASKTLWVNTLALIALFVQNSTGFVVAPEIQGAVLILANMVLRIVTKGSVSLA